MGHEIAHALERHGTSAMSKQLVLQFGSIAAIAILLDGGGTEEELAGVRKLFQIERKLVFEDPEYGPIYAHGSFIYLMDAEGELLTLIPPIISPDRGAEIVAKYAAAGES